MVLVFTYLGVGHCSSKSLRVSEINTEQVQHLNGFWPLASLELLIKEKQFAAVITGSLMDLLKNTSHRYRNDINTGFFLFISFLLIKFSQGEKKPLFTAKPRFMGLCLNEKRSL